jgi:uncharacterized membrane protein (DUF4010 family)
MTVPLRDSFVLLGIAVALGLLVGLQREHMGTKLAGLRTFALVTPLGTLAAMLDRAHQAGGWLLGAVFLGVVAVTLTAKILRRGTDAARYGMTTEAALLVMFGTGAYLVAGERLVAVVLGTTVAVLLQFKPELHGIARRLGDDDMRAIMRFALFSGVILPVLPNQQYGPFGVVNPFHIWLMVVLIVGISLGGYIVYKFYGERAGILLGGILGGAISSTATTVSYAKRAAGTPDAYRLCAVVIMISSTIVFVRVLVEISVVAPAHIVPLGRPMAIMLLAAVAASVLAWIGVRRHPIEMPPQSNPSELKPALVFAGIYTVVLISLAAGQRYFPERGTYAVAFFAGLSDMDAITLSTARVVQNNAGGEAMSAARGARLIVIASMSNLLFKWGITLLMGHPRLARRVGLLFLIPLLTGGVLLMLG